MYLLLHRAIKNAGDFLIHERAESLLRAERPDMEIQAGRSWIPLAEQLRPAERAALRAVIICGGPGYQRKMYPAVYPLTPLEDLPVVVPLALGSYLYPGTDQQIHRFRFDAESARFLTAVTDRIPHLGARDALTADLLAATGHRDVLMTGDPAWYDLQAMERPVEAGPVASLAFTPPANPIFFAQAQHLLERLVDRFGPPNVTVVFHRERQLPFYKTAREKGLAVEEISGGADGFRVYDGHSVHIGYRVHAHLYCLSRGRRSYLVAEDSRGRGALDTLGMLGVGANTVNEVSAAQRLAWRVLPRLASARRRSLSWLGPAASRLVRTHRVGDEILRQLSQDEQNGFARHAAAREVIAETLPAMRQMIREIP